jgi:hypothetical protein
MRNDRENFLFFIERVIVFDPTSYGCSALIGMISRDR